MRRSALLALAAATSLLAGAPVAAQGVIAVPIDQSIRLAMPGGVKKAFVGNEAVADVWVLNSQSLLLTGKSYGATNIMAMDALGRTIFRADLVVAAADVGRVSVYRGIDSRTDMACAPGCQVSMRSGGGSGGGGSSAASSAPSAPAGGNPVSNALAAAGAGGTP